MSRRPSLSFAALVLWGLMAAPAAAQFEGNLVLEPSGCEVTGHCTLGEELGYLDPAGVGWQARKGLLTDGASIPPWAQPYIGMPFDPAFIRAAVIHDHYCDRHVRPWRMTHRVFYDALRESGVAKLKAGIMYFAILVGGPKWSKLIPGKPCPIGTICIRSVEAGASVAGAGIMLAEDGSPYLSRPAQFGTAFFAVTMERHVPALEAMGESLEPEDVEAEAVRAMAGDFFFMSGDEVGTTLRFGPMVMR